MIGAALIQNEFEQVSTQAFVVVELSVGPIGTNRNLLSWHNTLVGGKGNGRHQDDQVVSGASSTYPYCIDFLRVC